MECGTKRPFATREDAEAQMKQVIWMNHVRGQDERSVGLNAYPCSQCSHWHYGHAPSVPLVYHYTTAEHLDAIIDSGCLKPARPKLITRQERRKLFSSRLTPIERNHMRRCIEEPVPLLWFSRNQDWEYSSGDSHGRAKAEINGGGLLRFGVSASVAKLRWSDYLTRNQIPSDLRDCIARYGDPCEWLATDEAVQLPLGNAPRWNVVRTVEVYCDERWQFLDDAADAFDAYISNREEVYRVARKTLDEKANALVEHLQAGDTMDVWHALDLNSLTEPERILWKDFVRWRWLKKEDESSRPDRSSARAASRDRQGRTG